MAAVTEGSIARGVAIGLACVALLACSDPPPPSSAAAEPVVDRSAGERPTEVVAELAFDGGDATMSALVSQLPPSTLRAALPTRVSTWLDGMIETPRPILSRVSTASPVRVVMLRVDGEVHSAIALRLDEPVPSEDRAPGGPRGASRVGERAAVDDRIAVVADDAVALDRAFAYLAYAALARPVDEGAVVALVPASTLATTLRQGLERMIEERRASLLASIAAARAVHDRPPDLGDPEALVGLVADALLARIAYLPDLGDATITLRPTSSGLALCVEAAVTPASPLALAIAARGSVPPALLAAMPTSAALVIATGTSTAAREATASELAETLAAIGGERVSASERVGLDHASAAIATIRGDEGALAIGASDANGLFAIGLVRGGTDAPAPMPWGRAFPWTSQLLGAIAGCAPRARGPTLCGDVSLATRVQDGVRADAIGRDATELAESTRAALARDAAAQSPDLARDLAALPGHAFALVLARPLRALPLIAAVGGPPLAGLPRGDGAAVLALAHEAGTLRIVLRASTAGLADLDVVRGLFAEETDSE